MVYPKYFWAMKCQRSGSCLLIKTSLHKMVRTMCSSSSVFPLDPWSRVLTCVSVSAFHFCSSSCLCPCSECSCNLASGAGLAFHQNSLSVLPVVSLITEPEKAMRAMPNPCGCIVPPTDWKSW